MSKHQAKGAGKSAGGAINFTKLALEKLPIPAPGQRVVYRDTKAAGLQLRITANGIKTFSIFRRVKGGAPERITLDRFPTMTVEQARTATAKANAEISSGGNPAAVKRAVKGELTFSGLWEEFLERHSKPNKRTSGDDEQRYRDYLAKPLGARKLSHITRQQITEIHDAVGAIRSPATANSVLALVSSICNWGISKSICEVNPAKGIKRHKTKSRTRFLQADEMPRFFKALAQEENETMRDFFLACLLTGARRENVITMRWSDINFERAEWRIGHTEGGGPDADKFRTKNDDPATLPLSPEMIQILRLRQPKKNAPANERTYVFPGTGEEGHIVTTQKCWVRIFDRDELEQLTKRIAEEGGEFVAAPETFLKKQLDDARERADKLGVDTTGARLEYLRPHDLRRTLGSWQAKQGASLVIIGKSLTHKSHQATQIYARLDMDPVRQSVESATSAMLVAGGVKTAAGVRSFKSSAKK